MSFATSAAKSSAPYRLIVEVDLGDTNTQWVNNGAGIWTVSATNTYAWVDVTLLDGFSAQEFGTIGGVRASGIPLQAAPSIEALATAPGAFYYDATSRMLYVAFPDFDEPSLHDVIIGAIYAFSDREFTPVDGTYEIEGRLLNVPDFKLSRDPLFFGRTTFPSVTLQIANADGEYDAWGDSVDIYGNEARVLVGFEDLSYDDYLQMYAGYVEKITVGEEYLTVNVADKRKQLTKPITYVCTALSALSAIEAIALSSYAYTYGSTFYDTANWEAARGNVEAVTIDMQEPRASIDVIEDICASVFGLFYVDGDGRFSFKVIDSDDSITALIPAEDVLTAHEIAYDPQSLISSVRVGYGRNWLTSQTSISAYSYYTNTDRQASVYTIAKTYNQRDFKTLLPSLSAATAFSTRVLDYTDELHGEQSITVPLEYYGVALGDQVGVEIDRGTRSMLGLKKCEVTSVEYLLDRPLMRLGLRHNGDVEAFLTTEGGDEFVTETEALMMVE